MGRCNFKDVLKQQETTNSPNIALHPAVRDSLFQSLRSFLYLESKKAFDKDRILLFF